MYLFFVRGMGSGFSYISKRYSKASNKYLKFYDPKRESKHYKQITDVTVQCLSFFQQVDLNR